MTTFNVCYRESKGFDISSIKVAVKSVDNGHGKGLTAGNPLDIAKCATVNAIK